MGRQIIKQPDGKYCVFSSITDSFIYEDATKEEVVEAFAEEAAAESRRATLAIFDQLDAGIAPYYQFTRTYASAKRLNDRIPEDDE